MLCTLFFYKLDYDDSFYLSLANQSMYDESIYSYDSTTGNKDFPLMAFYELESWELLLSFFGFLSKISTPILAHTIIPLILIPLSYFAYAKLFSVFVEKKYIALMLIFLSIFHLMGAYSSFSQGNFLLSRMWHGKAIYLNILLPLLQYYSIKYLIEFKLRNIIFACIIVIASLGLNPSSIYLSTFFVLAIMIAGIIIDTKQFRKVLNMSIIFIPIGCFAILLYRGARNYLNNWIIEDLQPLNFWGDLTNYIGNGYYIYFLLLIPMLIYKNNSKSVKLLTVYTVLLFILFLNPYSSQVLAEYFTSAQTYWRLFWLIPLGTIISLVGVKIFILSDRILFLKKSSVILFAFLLIISGEFIFSAENKFIKEWNLHKIPDEVVEVSQYLVSDTNIKIVADEEVSMYVRSMANNVELLYTRYAYMIGFLGESPEFNDRVVLYEIINGNYYDFEYFFENIKKYQINKVVINNEYSEIREFLIQNNVNIEYENSKFLIFNFD